MAFGFGFALTAIAKAVGFSPSSLFASGAQGAWYDPSDYTTLFEDAAGTIPITSPLEKPVGLMLDKSKGLVLGSELVVNGDFSGGSTGWTNVGPANWTFANGYAQTTGAAATAKQDNVLTIGKWYRVSVDVSNYAGGTGVNIYSGTTATPPSAPNIAIIAGNGTLVGYILANSTSLCFRSGANTTSCRVDNISVRELHGNHAYQSTTTSRPTLSARYNLLTKTENISHSDWAKSNVTIGTKGTDPIGGETADNCIPDAVLQTHRLSRTITSAGTFVYSFYAKANGYNKIGAWDHATTGARCAWLLSGAGSILDSGSGASNATIASVGGGWYRCSFSASVSGTVGYAVQILSPSYVSGAIGDIWTPDGTSGIYIWGADLRVANDGIGLPAYQRVDTATDYDYAGFPPYLKFDGTDDSMATGNIDFTATDKMSVFAGVRKLSDAAQANVIELSAHANANNGAFYLANPNGAGTDVNFFVKGTSSSQAYFADSASPVTKVFTGFADIASPSNNLRINGAQKANSVLTLGSGTFGNYPLYIGRRGGTTFPLNGRIYSLVVVGKLASAAEITATEAWVNQKTRAY